MDLVVHLELLPALSDPIDMLLMQHPQRPNANLQLLLLGFEDSDVRLSEAWLLGLGNALRHRRPELSVVIGMVSGQTAEAAAERRGLAPRGAAEY